MEEIIAYQRAGTQKDIYNESEVMSVPCPLCGANQYRMIYKERGALGIVRCLKCNLIYVNPRLKEPEKIYWGSTDKYFEEARLILEGKARHHRDPNYLIDLKTISRYKASGNFLDIGTNMGFFLRNARGGGWNLFGVEPSSSLAELARKYFNLNVKTAFLDEAGYSDSFFDVVTMVDVFEHLAEPGKMIKEISRILKDEGILFIRVPNCFFNLFKFHIASLTKKLKNYDIFDSYEHVVHYSQRTLRLMLEKHGFRVIDTFIGRPIQLPVWHNYVGQYYQYATPWRFDFIRQSARIVLYILANIEFRLRLNRAGYLASNIIVIAKKAQVP